MSLVLYMRTEDCDFLGDGTIAYDTGMSMERFLQSIIESNGAKTRGENKCPFA